MLIRLGPHHTNIGNELPRQTPTAVRNDCGQPSIGPNGVRDQSNSRTRSAIRPPYASHSYDLSPLAPLVTPTSLTSDGPLFHRHRQFNVTPVGRPGCASFAGAQVLVKERH